MIKIEIEGIDDLTAFLSLFQSQTLTKDINQLKEDLDKSTNLLQKAEENQNEPSSTKSS